MKRQKNDGRITDGVRVLWTTTVRRERKKRRRVPLMSDHIKMTVSLTDGIGCGQTGHKGVKEESNGDVKIE